MQEKSLASHSALLPDLAHGFEDVEVTGAALVVEEWKVSRGLNELVLHPAGPAGGH